MQTPGVLILEDPNDKARKTFSGFLFGALTSANQIRKKIDFGYGEVVFNTSMTGYQEILTDPSYYGQMISMTTPHVGNTGVNSEDIESSRIWCSGFIVHDLCQSPSNWRSKDALDEYLKLNQTPGLSGIDTRALTLFLRTHGVARGLILPKTEEDLASALFSELPLFEGRDLIQEVTAKKPYSWPIQPTQKKNKFHVVAMDFGIKWNLLRSLEELGCSIEVVSAKTTSTDILSKNPDGVFLSNGPGDPTAAPYAVKTVQGLLGKVPVFGVCMGHQILALALGGKTYKLKFGHRGGNQPVFDSLNRKVEISSHNHGYSVDGNSLPKGVVVTHTNLNDRTVEGLSVAELGAFSVQYHPEACPGPHDSASIFKKFIELMKTSRK